MSISYESIIIQLIQQDSVRMKALDSIRLLNLPQCYLAAGFIRNLVCISFKSTGLMHSTHQNPDISAKVLYFLQKGKLY
ncbi:hypothetical protein [Endozoicomonas numazuensis]|uniref:Uncharacterized protein n=1 Tax=Endozoicomonas numazuensis TaxID=1137799 RepID=A0A081NMG8_9GAMM|nr:hypothetical protein [Endozoicomonas numazuensis]KEQ19641.1 hypothetical protein GZ78_07045 [Endozoicomonas numazuensis]